MSNYYQQKKNYNKYNPTSSFSDFDCYGNNYFNNNNKSENNNKQPDQYTHKPNNKFENKINYRSNSYSNQFSKKTNNKKSSYNHSSDTSIKEKNTPPFVQLIIFYFIVFAFAFFYCMIARSNIIQSNNVFIKALFFTVIESPFLFIFWKLFLSKIHNTIMQECDDQTLSVGVAIIGIPLIMTTFNCGTIYILNKVLDNKPPLVRYLAITDKEVREHYDSKKHRTTYSYFIFFTSWVAVEDIRKSVSKTEFDSYEVGDVFKVNTRIGFFGCQYYDGINLYDKVDKNLFPRNTVFPLTEKEAKKLMEAKREADFEEELNPKKKKKK